MKEYLINESKKSLAQDKQTHESSGESSGGEGGRWVQHKHRTETRRQSWLKGEEDWPHPSHRTSCAEKMVLNENTPTVYKETNWSGFPNSALCSWIPEWGQQEWLTVFTYTFIDILTTCLLRIHYLIAFVVLKSLSQPFVNQTLLFPWGGGCEADGRGQAIGFSAFIQQREAWMKPPVPSAEQQR